MPATPPGRIRPIFFGVDADGVVAFGLTTALTYGEDGESIGGDGEAAGEEQSENVSYLDLDPTRVAIALVSSAV